MKLRRIQNLMQIHPGACGEVVASTNLDFFCTVPVYHIFGIFLLFVGHMLWGYSQNHSHHHTELTPEPYGSSMPSGVQGYAGGVWYAKTGLLGSHQGAMMATWKMEFTMIYPLVMSTKSYWTWWFIVDFPSYKMVDLSIVMLVYQRVMEFYSDSMGYEWDMVYQWIGLRENLNRKAPAHDLNGKIYGFRLKFSRVNQPIEMSSLDETGEFQ